MCVRIEIIETHVVWESYNSQIKDKGGETVRWVGHFSESFKLCKKNIYITCSNMKAEYYSTATTSYYNVQEYYT